MSARKWVAPSRIYLQPHMWPEVTWCQDQQMDEDVGYVRELYADDLTAQVAALTEERDRLRRALEKLRELEQERSPHAVTPAETIINEALHSPVDGGEK